MTQTHTNESAQGAESKATALSHTSHGTSANGNLAASRGPNVVTRPQSELLYRTALEPRNLTEAFEFATLMARINYCGIKTPEEGLAKVMFGRSLNLPALLACQKVYTVNGRPALDAGVMTGLVLQSEVCEYFRPVEGECDETKATYECKRRGDPKPYRHVYTIEQARKVVVSAADVDSKTGNILKPAVMLTDKDNWKSWPGIMLTHRCESQLARLKFPDAANGMMAAIYTPDEVEAGDAPVVPAQLAEAPIDMAAVEASKRKMEALKGIFIAKMEQIKAANDAPALKAFRTEFKKAEEAGLIAGPWLDEVRAAYGRIFAKKPAPPVEQPAETVDPETGEIQ